MSFLSADKSIESTTSKIKSEHKTKVSGEDTRLFIPDRLAADDGRPNSATFPSVSSSQNLQSPHDTDVIASLHRFCNRRRIEPKFDYDQVAPGRFMARLTLNEWISEKLGPYPSKKAARTELCRLGLQQLKSEGKVGFSGQAPSHQPNKTDQDHCGTKPTKLSSGKTDRETNWISSLNQYQQHVGETPPVYEEISDGLQFACKATLRTPAGIWYSAVSSKGHMSKREAKAAAAYEIVKQLRSDNIDITEDYRKKKPAAKGMVGGINARLRSPPPLYAINAPRSSMAIHTSNSHNVHLGDNIDKITTATSIGSGSKKACIQGIQQPENLLPATTFPQPYSSPPDQSKLDTEPVIETEPTFVAKAVALTNDLTLSPPIYNISVAISKDSPPTVSPPKYSGFATLTRHETLESHIPNPSTTNRYAIPRESTTRDVLVAEVKNVHSKTNAKEALARDVVRFLEDVKETQAEVKKRKVKAFRDYWTKFFAEEDLQKG